MSLHGTQEALRRSERITANITAGERLLSKTRTLPWYAWHRRAQLISEARALTEANTRMLALNQAQIAENAAAISRLAHPDQGNFS